VPRTFPGTTAPPARPRTGPAVSGVSARLFVIVAVFVVTWAAALSIWRFGKIEQKWELSTARADSD
jgi:hypothetical protein